ncbi:hypothetical protein [Alteraurantiacibacter buctensis]|uniref:Uncharacterized protein n=1 Tax=Alteraurantiacibacter buctensis TaxID=1503981 RepID=A0A844Z1J5_9SPHN|nr:hypothetical protein [Alteraurantiacibacter buctensis]MXO73218.1 hypothetical protein [Alteraurantiacibacter buctensis]
MRQVRFAIPLGLLLVLGACDYFGGGEQEAAGGATGQVLPASVSDEMIPVQDLTSQPPALAPAPGEGGSGAVATADSAVAAVSAGDGEAAAVEDATPAQPEAQ